MINIEINKRLLEIYFYLKEDKNKLLEFIKRK